MLVSTPTFLVLTPLVELPRLKLLVVAFLLTLFLKPGTSHVQLLFTVFTTDSRPLQLLNLSSVLNIHLTFDGSLKSPLGSERIKFAVQLEITRGPLGPKSNLFVLE